MSTEREVSAGGVVVNGEGDCVVIVPTRRARGGAKVLTLPKGHVEAGETAAEAARREVREEAGIEARVVEKLRDVRYWYQRGGMRIAKVVSFFLFAYVSGDLADHDAEVEEARWMPLDEAERRLTYRGERETVALAKVHPACRS
jgi:mutator protein MutT